MTLFVGRAIGVTHPWHSRRGHNKFHGAFNGTARKIAQVVQDVSWDGLRDNAIFHRSFHWVTDGSTKARPKRVDHWDLHGPIGCKLCDGTSRSTFYAISSKKIPWE